MSGDLIYEGDDMVRAAYCEEAGHDWDDEVLADVEICTACGATRAKGDA